MEEIQFVDFTNFVDFTDESLTSRIPTNPNQNFYKTLQKKVTSDRKYIKNGKIIIYDRSTDYYLGLRKSKIDPILFTLMDNRYAFKFYNEWDPYTGEILGNDPYGPLYFDPDNLVKYFYSIRLSKLYVREVQGDDNNYYEGYYDDGVGIGESFPVTGRGEHPEWYIFRLPIIDCYLTTEHNNQVITMGPKLSEEQIVEIDRLYKIKNKGNVRYNLLEIKKFYDIAISTEPELLDPQFSFDSSSMSKEEIANKRYSINKFAVDKLIKMR